MYTPKIWRPFTQMKIARQHIKVEQASGATLTLEDGTELIDAISSWWVITHGHCHPKIAEAIAKQASKVDQVLFANFSNKASEDLVNKLNKFLPKKLRNFFFSDNGSTAVEVALKMTTQYWKNVGEDQRKLFISFSKSYHGDTVGAMSVSGDSLFTEPFTDMLFQVLKVQQGLYSNDSIDKFTLPFLEAFDKYKNQIAGIIIEPLVQGAGGMIVWPKEAVNLICDIAQKNSIPIIFDEVMTGFGRTGSLFAFEQLEYEPDIICLSKGLTAGALPLSLTVSCDRIYDSFLSTEKSKMFFHGHSFTGNAISCAAAVASLELFESSNYTENLNRINRTHLRRIENISSNKVLDKRICGTIAVIELKTPNEGYQSGLSEEITKFAMQRNIFLRPLGNVIYILPPYSISDDQLNKVWDVIDAYLEDS